jgi:serine/threonine protein kinase
VLSDGDGESPKAEVSLGFVDERPVADSTPCFQAGTLIQGRYELQEEVGVGGLGAVWSARHLGLDESVALKFLKPELANHAEAVSRFNAEARACFVLRSEHVVRVLDVDSYAGVPFIVMELLEGIDLRRVLSTATELDPAVVVDYALQVCEGLCAAHASGIIHRDIKPENLFLHGNPDDSRIKVLDFGISQLQAAYGHEPHMHDFDADAPAGTPPYMSPEQLSAATVDARSDVWSLGCVLYELLTGTAPFERETMQESCDAVRTLDPPALSTLRPTLAPALCAAVERCLSKDPAGRYADAAQLAAALAPHGTGVFEDYPVRCAAQLANERRSVPPELSATAAAISDSDDALDLLPTPTLSALLSATSLREAVEIGKRLLAPARATVIARVQAAPRRSLWAAVAMLTVLWAWSWAQSREQALHIVTPSTASDQLSTPELEATSFAHSDAVPLGAAAALEQGKAEPKELNHQVKRRRHMQRGRYQRRHAQREPDVGF